MSNHIITREELYQTLWKRRPKTDQIDGHSIKDEDFNKLIINNKTEKFLELFEKVFSSEEEEEEEHLDSEDGLVQDIFNRIVLNIKEKIKSVNKSKILSFIFNFFIRDPTDTNSIDGKDKSDCT